MVSPWPMSSRCTAWGRRGLFGEVTGADAMMWGSSIVGYGELHYVYESGREGDMPRAAFSPRSASHTFHLALDVLRDLVVLAWETQPQQGSSC